MIFIIFEKVLNCYYLVGEEESVYNKLDKRLGGM